MDYVNQNEERHFKQFKLNLCKGEMFYRSKNKYEI